MWKLVKAELAYLRPLILFSYALFLALSLSSPYLVGSSGNPPAGFDYFFFMIIWIIAVHLVIVFVSLYHETKERRIALFDVMPIRNVQVGYERILVPFAIVMLHAMLAAACGLVLIAVYPSGISERFPSTQRGADFLLLSINTLSLLLISTYAIRLLSEWQGRVLFFGAILLLPIFDFIIGATKPGIMVKIDKCILYVFSGPHGLILKVIIPIALCFIIHLSFMRRRSYLS